MHPFSEELKKEWNGWEVRAMVLASLLLQIILVIFGSQRKYTRTSGIHFLVWFAYLMADSTATVALGTLARSQGDFHDNSQKSSKALQAFWAPFLLLHLGGPDTITAYSLEDNELWLRHFLWLVVQVGVAFYVLIRSWYNTSSFTILVIPVYITGIIKYGERTWVLRSSSAQQLKDSLRPTPDPGPDVEITSSSAIPQESAAVIYVSKQSIRAGNNYLSGAYFLFERFQYLFANLILGYHEQKDSYAIIHNKLAIDAFKLVAVELGFMYDQLYTKATIIYSQTGIILRVTHFSLHFSALVTFLTIFDKHFYPSIDIYITHALLFGAGFLETYAFIMLLFSDWTKLWLVESKATNTERPSSTELQNTNTEPCLSRLRNTDTEQRTCSFSSLLPKRKRWSESMGQYNLLSFCVKDMSTKCVGAQKLLGIKELLEKYWYLTWTNVDDNLQKLIFRMIQENGNKIKDGNYDINLCKRLLAQRGDYVLSQKFYLDEQGRNMSCLDEFLWSTIEVEFDHSLLLWHIATDLCYYDDLDNHEEATNLPLKSKLSKCVSDYMLYLLVICPSMLPQGIGEIRYRDTCAEATRFFRKRRHDSCDSEDKACKLLLHARTIDDSALERIKGDKSKSVLFYGRRLAKQLQLLESRSGWSKEQKWEMITDVWLEMLTYAANHCAWKEHGQQLMKGGELLTHVCVLMAHFGLSKQYQIQTPVTFLNYRDRNYRDRSYFFWDRGIVSHVQRLSVFVSRHL